MTNDKATRTIPAKEESPNLTDAEIIFKDKKILTERPPDMSYEEYTFLRKTQQLIIKSLFRHCPDRNLSRITSSRLDKTPLANTKKGMRRIMRQRKAS